MIARFDSSARRVVVPGLVTGPVRTSRVQLVVDTGASHTVVSAAVLTTAGFDLTTATRHGRLRSATGGERAPVVPVRQFLVLGQVRTEFPVVAHDLPPAVPYDGLLGLDFFRGHVLTLDLARGRISLRRPGRWWQLWR